MIHGRTRETGAPHRARGWNPARLSIVGVLAGTVFLAVSLSPSLLPRPPLVQGVLAGMAFAIGYGLGTTGLAAWRFLQLPVAGARLSRMLTLAAAGLCAVVVLSFLWRASSWQNDLRARFGMEEIAGLDLLAVGPVAAAVFAVLLLLARLFRRTFQFLSGQLARFVPPRISGLVGVLAAAWLFWAAIDGVLFGVMLRATDRSFQELDALIEDDQPRPSRPEQTGSEASLVAWEGLGRQGRRFVSGGPDLEAMNGFFGEPVTLPLRVYVGLNSAETPRQRARLALEELRRVGAFDRSVLLLVTPTGTGWVDEAGQDTAEYLFRGDVATVVVQYSYLNSPLALLTQRAYGAETARAVFVAIYGHWRSLPPDRRPRLFLNGLSLGSLNSDLSFELVDIIDAPFDGALWSGPPFRNESWRRMTRDREPGSPAWLPVYRGGTVVRFMNQVRGVREGYGDWSTFRIVFLQYASDPITFFDPSIAWREPDWMRAPRGPDVSPDLRWYPIVTMLQLAADMVVGTAPRGFGHEYAAADYLEAWIALAEPGDWTAAELDRLRTRFRE